MVMSSGTSNRWSGRRVTEARAFIAARLPLTCTICEKTVNVGDPFVVAHKVPRWQRPDLTWVPSNWGADHKKCSDQSGQRSVIEKARAEGAAMAFSGAGAPSTVAASPSFSLPDAPETPQVTQNPPLEVRTALGWRNPAQTAPEWLSGLQSVPDNAGAPLAATPPHPEAVGSYGWSAIAWIEEQFRVTLRWWQRLTVVRMLEHRQDGTLCWRTVLLSASRRSGKSILLKAVACWRLAHGPALFGETQTVLHFGSDTAILREVQRGAWRWAEEAAGWKVSRANGKEAIETPDGDRWLTRAKDAVYGYDVCLGLGDEVWDVPDSTVTDGIEPAMLERLSPQLLLTSTAHRRARPTMKKRMAAALADDDGQTLLLLWGARPQDDPSDIATWRAASPHWSADRERTLAAKYAAALAGEGGADLDDPDPMAGFVSQYLNVWRFSENAIVKGDPVFGEQEWKEQMAPTPDGPPLVVAVESWFADGVSVAASWGVNGSVIVSSESFPDAARAAEWIRELDCPLILCGKSLLPDPAFTGLDMEGKGGTSKQAIADLRRLFDEGVLFHDGSPALTEQATGVRATPSTDGFTIRSTGPLAAVKAASWSAERARAFTEEPAIW